MIIRVPQTVGRVGHPGSGAQIDLPDIRVFT